MEVILLARVLYTDRNKHTVGLLGKTYIDGISTWVLNKKPRFRVRKMREIYDAKKTTTNREYLAHNF